MTWCYNLRLITQAKSVLYCSYLESALWRFFCYSLSMNTIGLIIMAIAIVISFNRMQRKFDDLDFEILQLKEKLKEKGFID